MKNTQRKHLDVMRKVAARTGAVLLMLPYVLWAADIDIYGPSAQGTAPNVMFLLDNTSNWSSNNQNWNAGDSWAKCKDADDTKVSAAELVCQDLIKTVYYNDAYENPISVIYPWTAGYKANKDNVSLTQGQVQLRALKLVLDRLICNPPAGKSPLNVNVGISMIGTSGSVLSNGHATGYIRFAIQKLLSSGFSPTPTVSYLNPKDGVSVATSSCQALKNDFNYIDDKITNPTFKAPSNANYGAAMYEIFKYFGGHSNPTLAPEPPPNGASPIGATGYGPLRFSNVNTLDDPNAFVDPGAKSTYKSPISTANSCGANYVVLVGNTYPNQEASNGGPTIFSGINYTPPVLNPNTSDTSRYADEWSYFLANTDVSKEDGVQFVRTFTVNTYKDKPSTDQSKLLKSMAAVGGLDGYYEVNGDLGAMVDAFENAIVNIAAVNSVFTATTLPVSTTTQGTFLNQVFIGMFRPDAQFSPRWLGNLKQYQLGFINGELDLLGANNNTAVKGAFFDVTAQSFWTKNSVFFSESPSGSPASASDMPDGAIVEKGGAAQMLRESNLQISTNRKVYTLPAAPAKNDLLSATAFSSSNTAVTAVFSTAEIAWARGENNVASGVGKEDLNGSYLVGTTTTPLGTQGARHSIHGDVLHSRPVALNYGSGDVVVYYGTNDGFFHAVDGNKTGNTAGQELWSFVAPEHYSLIKRLRSATPELQLPEVDATGKTITPPDGSAPKNYGIDGPIGVFARYAKASEGGALSDAMIYPAMRRGGNVVYAFDVHLKDAPSFQWKITGGSGDYAHLGQTWSMPRPIVLPSKVLPLPLILVMGGGYDPKEDQDSISSPQVGNAVYIINGRTGALIKELVTEFSVPSDVTLADIDGNGMPDRAYVADVRGNLYRIDFPALADLDTADNLTAYFNSWASVEAVKIAELGGKVFYPPDVVVTKNFVAVMAGTGDREKPLLSSTTDKFFLIKDNLGSPRSPALKLSDLTKVGQIDNATMKWTGLVSAVDDPEGCYLQLATNGEKVINAPISIAGMAYFATNRPTPVNRNQCSGDLGEAYAYQFPLFCSVPSNPIPSGSGLLPSAVAGVVVIDINGVPTKVPFIIGGGKGGSAFKPDQPKPSVAPVRSRLFWRIDNKNR